MFLDYTAETQRKKCHAFSNKTSFINVEIFDSIRRITTGIWPQTFRAVHCETVQASRIER